MSALLYNDVCSKIEQQIKDNIYIEGEKLPSERTMSIEYGVSRNVIRESVRLLSEKGLLEIKPGKGIYAKKPDGELITDSIKRVLQSKGATLLEMTEVREALEIAVIQKAVERVTTENMKELKSTFNEMEKHVRDVPRFIEYDAH